MLRTAIFFLASIVMLIASSFGSAFAKCESEPGVSKCIDVMTVQSVYSNANEVEKFLAIDVQGTAKKVKKTKSQSGNLYTTLEVTDGTAPIGLKVFMWGHADVQENDKIECIGWFRNLQWIGSASGSFPVEKQLNGQCVKQ